MTARLSSERSVLFPAPRLPSIEITPDILAIKPLNHKLNFQSELILVLSQKDEAHIKNDLQTELPAH